MRRRGERHFRLKDCQAPDRPDDAEFVYSPPSHPGGERRLKDKLELWQSLCAQAAVEQDPQKLMELVNEINRLLGEKQERLSRAANDGNEG